MNRQGDGIGKHNESARQVKDSLKDKKALPERETLPREALFREALSREALPGRKALRPEREGFDKNIRQDREPPLEKALPISAGVTRTLFLTSLGVFFVYAVSVLVAKILEFAVDPHIIAVVLMSIVVILEALFYFVAYLTAAGGMTQSQGLTCYGRFYILRMLVVMKTGIIIASLVCMAVLFCYGFNFQSLSSPWTLAIYILLTYATVFVLCIFLPGFYYAVRICVSARRSFLEWRAVQVVLLQVLVIAVTVTLMVLCQVFGTVSAGVILLAIILLLTDCLLISYERRRVAKCFHVQAKHCYSKLYGVILFLHIPAWLILLRLAGVIV